MKLSKKTSPFDVDFFSATYLLKIPTNKKISKIMVSQ